MADANVTPKEFANWIPVGVALSRVGAAVGEAIAKQAILERLRGGLLRSAAKWIYDDSPGNEPVRRDLSSIEPHAWNHLLTEDFWETETARFFELKFGGGKHDQSVRCFNVRFEPAGVRDMIPRTTPVRRGPHEGGRPRKDYWDDLWIEICRQLYFRELKPRLQSDIEKAMLNWASRHKKDLSVASARPRARRLFAVIKPTDKN